jgi:hypothetical protein
MSKQIPGVDRKERSDMDAPATKADLIAFKNSLIRWLVSAAFLAALARYFLERFIE